MADDPGYIIIQKAVPAASIQKVVDDMGRGLEISSAKDKYTEYKIPESALAVRDEFAKVRLHICFYVRTSDVG